MFLKLAIGALEQSQAPVYLFKVNNKGTWPKPSVFIVYLHHVL